MTTTTVIGDTIAFIVAGSLVCVVVLAAGHLFALARSLTKELCASRRRRWWL